MSNFIIRKQFLPFDLAYDKEMVKKIDQFLKLLEKSGVSKFLETYYATGRPATNLYNLFATVIYGFAFGSPTLRELETSCKYDLRFRYIMEGETPSHKVFGQFINKFIKPNIEKIFHQISSTIAKEIGANIHDYAFIDGTKFEADCNKYKFVRKPTTFHKNLTVKIINELKAFNLQRDISENELINSKKLAEKINQLNLINVTSKNKKQIAKTNKFLLNALNKILEYEEKERICGPDRKSFYKTDYDATAMCLKDDYYAGLGSSMHAAYSTQIVVSNYLITSYIVSQSRTDFTDFVKVLQVYFKNYGCYPLKICADAGYGSEENYFFMKTNNIQSFVKFQSWQGNVSGRNPDRYYLYDSGYIKCIYGRLGHEVLPNYNRRYKDSKFYKVFNCSFCEVNNYCKLFNANKNSSSKTFEVREDFTLLKQKSNSNLLSVEGIELRVNRSMQVEGAYGVIKQDISYTRLRRTSFDSVNTEIGLTFLAYNVRKYFSFLSGKKINKFWKAPKNAFPEEFKKPRFKILQKRKVNSNKEPNQKIKSEYKHKKRG